MLIENDHIKLTELSHIQIDGEAQFNTECVDTIYTPESIRNDGTDMDVYSIGMLMLNLLHYSKVPDPTEAQRSFEEMVKEHFEGLLSIISYS